MSNSDRADSYSRKPQQEPSDRTVSKATWLPFKSATFHIQVTATNGVGGKIGQGKRVAQPAPGGGVQGAVRLATKLVF